VMKIYRAMEPFLYRRKLDSRSAKFAHFPNSRPAI
jgi:hypothetical protein